MHGPLNVKILHIYLVNVILCNNVLVKLIRTYICTPTNYYYYYSLL